MSTVDKCGLGGTITPLVGVLATAAAAASKLDGFVVGIPKLNDEGMADCCCVP